MDAHARFTAWLADGGATLDGLTVGAVAGGRGVIATRGFAAGDVVARVPRAALITRELARASSVGRQIRAADLELGTHALFAAWLCVERRAAAAPHQPYFAILPDDFTGFPLRASPTERAQLAGSLTGALLDELCADVARDHAALVARVRLCRGLSADDYAWARLCVASRVFALSIDGVDTTALVPLGDLLNHDRDPDTRWAYDQDAAAFTLTATRAIAAGAEIRDSYGAKSNARFAIQYGFALDDNPDDEAELLGRRVTRDLAGPVAQGLWTELRARHPDAAATQAALAGAIDAALARLPALPPDDASALARACRGERAVLAAWRGFTPPP